MSLKEFLKEQKGFENAQVFTISASSHKGVDELVKAIFEVLDTIPRPEKIEAEIFDFDLPEEKVAEFHKLDDETYEVVGGKIDELARKTDVNDMDSLVYFQRRLKEDGIIRELLKMGLKDGDTVIIGEIEFEYTE